MGPALGCGAIATSLPTDATGATAPEPTCDPEMEAEVVQTKEHRRHSQELRGLRLEGPGPPQEEKRRQLTAPPGAHLGAGLPLHPSAWEEGGAWRKLSQDRPWVALEGTVVVAGGVQPPLQEPACLSWWPLPEALGSPAC